MQAGGGDVDEHAARPLPWVVELVDPRRGPVLVEDRCAQRPSVSGFGGGRATLRRSSTVRVLAREGGAGFPLSHSRRHTRSVTAASRLAQSRLLTTTTAAGCRPLPWAERRCHRSSRDRSRPRFGCSRIATGPNPRNDVEVIALDVRGNDVTGRGSERGRDRSLSRQAGVSAAEWRLLRGPGRASCRLGKAPRGASFPRGRNTGRGGTG
jgi:hypothetical protein